MTRKPFLRRVAVAMIGALALSLLIAPAAMASRPAASTFAPAVATDQYVPVDPRRVADTRTGDGGIVTADGGHAPTAGRLDSNRLYNFRYDGNDVPQGVAAHVFNVTATHPSRSGNLRVAPLCDEGQSVPSSTEIPTTSLVNYDSRRLSRFSHQTRAMANMIVVPDGCEGLRLYSSSARAGVVIDLEGYYPTDAGITPITPTRIVDTRAVQGGTGPIRANTSRAFQISGAAGIPAGAKAVALNITAVQSRPGHGNLRVYPDSSAVPNITNISYSSAQPSAAEFVVVKLPANGKLDIYSARNAADVIIDAFAYYPTTATTVITDPVRVVDTRRTTELRRFHAVDVHVAGLGGVPADAQAVLLSVTAIGTEFGGAGNLRVYPTGGSVPNISTLNYPCNVSNFVIVKVGSDGRIGLYSAWDDVNVTLDVYGYVPAGS